MPVGVYTRKPLTQEHRNNIGKAHLGMKRTKETCLNISKSLIGRKLSKESRQKMSLAKIGKKHTEEHKKNMRIGMKGIKKPPFTKEHIENMRLAKLGKKHILTFVGKKSFTEKTSKENNWNWKEDSTKIKIGDRNLHDPLYKQWHKNVKNRDGWKCRISNSSCSGRLEAHHILSWRDHKELRYEINNGITLCHFHHPRKRIDEINLSPYFKSLVAKLD